MNCRAILIVMLVFFINTKAYSQAELQETYSVRFDKIHPKEAIHALSDLTQVNIIFSDNIFSPDDRISLHARKWPLKVILQQLIKDFDIEYKWASGYIILIKKEPEIFTYKGYIKDANNGEPLIGATIGLKDESKGAYTNEYGFFSISLPKGRYEFFISFTGYKVAERSIYLFDNRSTQIRLQPSLMLEEIVVRSKPSGFRLKGLPAPNQYELSVPHVAVMPALGGEADAFRMSHNLPGVQTGADGLGGLHIRGGSADQNLVLFDGVPVYNPNHALGLFSIFDLETVHSFKLMKGGFPAKYGGRLSSVIDVRTREGNTKHYRASLTTGLIATKGLLEGPIVKDKGGFMLLARRTHLDFLLRNLSRSMRNKDGQKGEYQYAFHDILAKAHYQVSPKDKVFFSFYAGRDQFADQKTIFDRFLFQDQDIRIETSDKQDIGWGNQLMALRWNREFSPKTFANFTATYSRFNFLSEKNFEIRYFENDIQTNGLPAELFESSSAITSYSIAAAFTTNLQPGLQLEYGTRINRQRFQSGNFQFPQDTISQLDMFQNPILKANEYSLYADANWVATSKLQFNFGLRADAFTTQGERFLYLQPRLGMSYLFSPKLKGFAFWGKMNQSLHVLTESKFGLPEDTYVPATAEAPPQTSTLYETGLQYKISNAVQLRLDLYYKDFDNLVDLVPGVPLYSRPGIDDELSYTTKIATGSGYSYGVELLLEKKLGFWQGGLGYTWARSRRNFDAINDGLDFNYRYDRRHTINLYSDIKIAERYILSFSWLFGTGQLVSLPVGQYTFPEGPYYLDYEKNNVRLPANHRLDVSGRYEKNTKWGNFSATLGVYNAYSRNNPFNMIYRPSYFQLQQPKYLEVYLLPILPYFSLKFEFQ